MFGLTTRRPEDVESEEAEAPDRRKVLALGALAAVLVLALGYFLVLPAFAGSSDDSETTAVAPRAPRASTAPTPAATPPAQLPQPGAVDGNNAGRDPFAPLPVEAEAAAASAAAAATPTVGDPAAGTATAGDPAAAGGTTTATAADGTTPPAGTAPAAAGGTTAAPTSNGTATAATKPVQLVAVTGGTAKVEVDSVPYPAKAGSLIASRYKVVSVAPDSVTLSRSGKTTKLALGELQNL